MLASYFESIKYVGHLWPVALIRITVGYQYLSLVLARIQQGYFEHAYLSEQLDLSGQTGLSSSLYFELLKGTVQGQWLLVTYVLVVSEILIGLSYVLGFGVRLTSLLGILLSFHFYLFFDASFSAGQQYLILLHTLFCLIGAGRCLGLDFYFYKSRRGLLW